MTETVQRLKTELSVLSNPERAEIAHFLLTSLEDEAEIAAAWKSEVKQRMKEIRSGQAQGTSAEQLLAELRERYP